MVSQFVLQSDWLDLNKCPTKKIYLTSWHKRENWLCPTLCTSSHINAHKHLPIDQQKYHTGTIPKSIWKVFCKILHKETNSCQSSLMISLPKIAPTPAVSQELVGRECHSRLNFPGGPAHLMLYIFALPSLSPSFTPALPYPCLCLASSYSFLNVNINVSSFTKPLVSPQVGFSTLSMCVFTYIGISWHHCSCALTCLSSLNCGLLEDREYVSST